MNIYDEAVLAWANDVLEKRGHPREAETVYFGHYIGCYSSYTCDYDVSATIVYSGGKEYVTSHVWDDVLRALPEYVDAVERMHEEHDRYHGRDDE